MLNWTSWDHVDLTSNTRDHRATCSAAMDSSRSVSAPLPPGLSLARDHHSRNILSLLKLLLLQWGELVVVVFVDSTWIDTLSKVLRCLRSNYTLIQTSCVVRRVLPSVVLTALSSWDLSLRSRALGLSELLLQLFGSLSYLLRGLEACLLIGINVGLLVDLAVVIINFETVSLLV